MGENETLVGVLARYDEVAARTESVIAGIPDLGQPVPVPKGVPWYPDDLEAWSVRWVLLHLIEETARHAGHADIVRESVDGATGFPLAGREPGMAGDAVVAAVAAAGSRGDTALRSARGEDEECA